MIATESQIKTESQVKQERLSVGTAVTIGIGGRRLYRVDVDLGESSLVVMELPASEIKESNAEQDKRG